MCSAFSNYIQNEIRHGKEEGLAEGLAEGKAQGIMEGKAQGIVEGKAQGIVEGRVKGKHESKLEIARKMIQAGKYAIEEISYLTDLDIESLKELQIAYG